MSSAKINLNYWRCFEQIQFSLPQHSFLLFDENGSGKTSLLSAYYSLLSGKPWPSSKWKDNLQQGRNYFGISTAEDWNITGKIAPSGRLVTQNNFPENISRPKIITYLPSDNYFLNLPRSSKLGVLDNSLSEIYGKEYTLLLDTLDRAVRSKNQLIKNFLQENIQPDKILLDGINSNIYTSTIALWVKRANFFQDLYLNKSIFADWINSSFKDWQIDWEITNSIGYKLSLKKLDTNFNWEFWSSLGQQQKELYFKNLLGLIDFNFLWMKEAAAGKTLFGANRDDFNWTSKHQNATEILSRGEMRLLSLFWKEIVRKNLPEEASVIWLLDDLFNELDSTREFLFFNTVKLEQDYFFATSTRAVNFKLPTYSLKDLTNTTIQANFE